MPALVRLYIRHCIIGFVLAAAFVGLLFALNVGNLWHLVTHTREGLLAAALLVVFNGIVFSGVQFGFAVMSMGRSDDDAPRGGRRQTVPVPVPVRAGAPVRR